jgi:hypothetical protein
MEEGGLHGSYCRSIEQTRRLLAKEEEGRQAKRGRGGPNGGSGGKNNATDPAASYPSSTFALGTS